MSIALGIKCSKDSIDWAIVDGEDRYSASVVMSGKETAPPGERGEQLNWIRNEILEILEKLPLDVVGLRCLDAGGPGNPIPRAEVEGVTQEAAKAGGFSPRRFVSASIRGAFSVKNKAELEKSLELFPAIAATPKSRRDPVIVAIAMIGE